MLSLGTQYVKKDREMVGGEAFLLAACKVSPPESKTVQHDEGVYNLSQKRQ